MTQIRYEFGALSHGALIAGRVAGAGALAVTGTATVAGSRPTVPAGASVARLTAIDGHVIAEHGADPTAAQDNGILVPAGATEAIGVAAGEKLSFVELAP